VVCCQRRVASPQISLAATSTCLNTLNLNKFVLRFDLAVVTHVPAADIVFVITSKLSCGSRWLRLAKKILVAIPIRRRLVSSNALNFTEKSLLEDGRGCCAGWPV
jgi:hypothetical protein